MKQNSTQHQPLPIFTVPIHLLIKLDRSNGIPLYRQISQGLREAIQSGELAAGTRLPTERALAHELGVNRTTIMNAYNDLSSEGLIEGHVGRGTIVKRQYDPDDDYLDQESPSWLFGLASDEETLLGPDARLLSELTAIDERQGIISLAQGTPDPNTIPAEFFRDIINKKLLQDRQHALGYCPVEGSLELRRTIAARMRQRGINVDTGNILILSGSTQGLGLVSRFLLNPGDEVVVEIPTYLGAIQTFRALKARVIGVPMDNDGMRIDLLESILARRQPRLIYTLPTFHNPTGAVLSPERRRRLLLLAQRYQIPIVEDDTYGELYFTDQAPQPLKTLDTHGNVLYISTYSKLIAPGLRVAWLAAPEPVIERLSLHKQIFDLNTNAIGQWLISQMYQAGLMDDYLKNLRQLYKNKRDIMLHAIKTCWPDEIRVNRPDGGMHLWCHLPKHLRARTLLREASHERVAFVIGEPFHVDGGGRHCMRLSFAAPEEQHIEEGIRRIGTTITTIQERRSRPDEPDQTIERLPIL